MPLNSTENTWYGTVITQGDHEVAVMCTEENSIATGITGVPAYGRVTARDDVGKTCKRCP